MKKYIPIYLLVVLVLVTLSCGLNREGTQTPPPTFTPKPSKTVQSAIELLSANADTPTPTPTPTETPIPELTLTSFPFVDALECSWAVPITPTKFIFGGNLYFHIPKYETTKLNLYEVDNNLQNISIIGSHLSGSDQYLGPQAFISPNNEWVFVRTDWVPTDDDDTPPPILVAAIDLSEKILISWEEEWEIALGWWDDETIIILPVDGGISDILLLNIFSEETTPFEVTENSADINLLTLWEDSQWRGEFGIGVAFNHSFTQTLRFDVDGGSGLVLNNIDTVNPIFSLDQPREYPYSPILEGIAIWSPDNHYIGVPLTNGETQELFLITATGEIWQVTDFQNTEYEDVFVYPGVWSHDGTQLAFSVSYTESGEEISHHIFILDLENEEIRSMCANGKPAAFSPDDAYLAYYGNLITSDIITRIMVLDPFTGEKWLLDETKNWYIIDWIE